jgi:hypothetical protein
MLESPSAPTLKWTASAQFSGDGRGTKGEGTRELEVGSVFKVQECIIFNY